MRTIWVGIEAKTDETRVLAMAGPTAVILKARLSARARHPRSVPSLLEALALWEGASVRAVLAVGSQDNSCITRLALDGFADVEGQPLYTVEFVRAEGPRRVRDDVGGMGDFRDLRQLLHFEVAR
jgi:hypothetical protein